MLPLVGLLEVRATGGPIRYMPDAARSWRKTPRRPSHPLGRRMGEREVASTSRPYPVGALGLCTRYTRRSRAEVLGQPLVGLLAEQDLCGFVQTR